MSTFIITDQISVWVSVCPKHPFYCSASLNYLAESFLQSQITITPSKNHSRAKQYFRQDKSMTQVDPLRVTRLLLAVQLCFSAH